MKLFGYDFKLNMAKLGAKTQPMNNNGSKPFRDKFVVKMEQQFKYRSQEDIDTWMAGLFAAESITQPTRWRLLNTFDQTMMDAHLSGVWENHIVNRVLAEPFSIVNVADGSIDAEYTALFKSMWFEDFVRLALESKLYGHSLIQIELNRVDGIPTVEVTLIPRRNVRPETGEILYNPSDSKGFDYVNDDSLQTYLVECGKPEDLGWLNKLTPLVIFKKFGMAGWSQWTEMFAQPLRIGTTISRETKDIDRLERALEDMGESAYAVMAEGEKIELVESKRTDAYAVYDKFAERIDGYISKLIVGGTLLSDSGVNGSRSLGEVQERSTQVVIEAHKRFIQYHINNQLIKKLDAQGWSFAGKAFKYNEQKDLNTLFDRVSGLLQHFDIEPEWIETELGIPVKPKAQPAGPAPVLPPKK